MLSEIIVGRSFGTAFMNILTKGRSITGPRMIDRGGCTQHGIQVNRWWKTHHTLITLRFCLMMVQLTTRCLRFTIQSGWTHTKSALKIRRKVG
ncbi:hypothetical protein Hanom_Chr06g00505591 [Helianthus anomalus]